MVKSGLESASTRDLALYAQTTDHGLELVHIILEGALSFFTNTTNSREIGWRRTSYGGNSPFIRKSAKQKQVLDVASALYASECVRQGMPLPNFGDKLVTIWIYLRDMRRRFDSHNYPKSILDWLEGLCLFDDDSQAEVHCIKKSERNIPDSHTTEIVITPREFYSDSLVKVLNGVYVEAQRCAHLSRARSPDPR